MKLTKNHIYIISAVVVIAIVYWFFFRKKKITAMVTPPPAPKSESDFFGEDWGWGTGPQQITKEQALYSMSGPAGNSVAGTMESGFNVKTGLVENGRYGANAFPSNSMSQTGMFKKVQNSPNANAAQLNTPWPTSAGMETAFSGSWLK